MPLCPCNILPSSALLASFVPAFCDSLDLQHPRLLRLALVQLARQSFTLCLSSMSVRDDRSLTDSSGIHNACNGMSREATCTITPFSDPPRQHRVLHPGPHSLACTPPTCVSGWGGWPCSHAARISRMASIKF